MVPTSSAPQLESRDTGRLILNALRWAAGEATNPPRIGVVGASELHGWLRGSGHDVVKASLTTDSLKLVDVVAVDIWNQSVAEIEALSSFVAGGGGLLAATTGWGWAQLHPNLDLITSSQAIGCSPESVYGGHMTGSIAHRLRDTPLMDVPMS